MSTATQLDYDEAMRAMALRNESVRSSWRASQRISPVQSSRRHSARVEKPRSYHPSPRTPEHRRAATSTRHYSAMEDHYRRMMGLEDEDETSDDSLPVIQPNMRPVSWHPGSSSAHENYVQVYTNEPSPSSQYLSYQNSPFYSTVTQAPALQSAWSSYMHGDFSSADGQNQPTSVRSEPTSWFDGGAAQPENRNPSTWIESESNARRHEREPSVELVGLGLYDEPGFTVKIGSKLEEECDPPEFDAEDEEEEESEEEEELPKPEEAKVVQPTLPLDMSGRSFFVGSDEVYRSGWWSESKHPQQTISSVNYGWI